MEKCWLNYLSLVIQQTFIHHLTYYVLRQIPEIQRLLLTSTVLVGFIKGLYT